MSAALLNEESVYAFFGTSSGDLEAYRVNQQSRRLEELETYKLKGSVLCL